VPMRWEWLKPALLAAPRIAFTGPQRSTHISLKLIVTSATNCSPNSLASQIWLEFISRKGRIGRRCFIRCCCRRCCCCRRKFCRFKRQCHICGFEQLAEQPLPLRQLRLQAALERPLVGIHPLARRLMGGPRDIGRVQQRRAHWHTHRDHQGGQAGAIHAAVQRVSFAHKNCL
jgi:hypothetical protein